jgi:flagellar secretion chaperone FliS
MTSARRAINAYVQTEIDTAVPEADGHRLVVMLFDGALTAVADARLKLQQGDIPGRGKAISKAIAIIDEGLRASLDRKQGGDIAAQLEDLYRYMCARLMHANLRSDVNALDEVTDLLAEIESGWKSIGPAQSPMKVAQEARI